MKQELNLDTLPVVNSDDFLTPVSLWTKLTGMFLVATVGSLLVLSSTVKYNVTVRTTAYVRPEGDLRVIQATTDGAIESIKVSENQYVQAGEIIAQINDNELQARKAQLQETIQTLQAQITQIETQISTIDRQILAEFNAARRAVASAEADLLRVQREYQDNLLTTDSDVQSAQASLRFALEERELYRNLVATGAVPEIQVREKERSFLIAEAKLEGALAVDNPSAAPIIVAAERIEQEQARGEAALALLEREQESLIQSQFQLEEKIRTSLKDLEKVEGELNRYIIRAPANGTVLNLQLRNESQFIRSGERIANISPANAPLLVVAYVKDDDIGRVKIGQKVKLRISAYPYPDFGTLQGKISSISPDIISPDGQSNSQSSHLNPTSMQSSERYYEAKIITDEVAFAKHNKQYPIQPGMEARADIISSEETVLNFLLRKARLIVDL